MRVRISPSSRPHCRRQDWLSTVAMLLVLTAQLLMSAAHAQTGTSSPRLNLTGAWEGGILGGSTFKLAQDGDRVAGTFEFGNGKGVARGQWRGGSLILILTPTETQSGNACDPRKILVIGAKGAVTRLAPYVLDLAGGTAYKGVMARTSPSPGTIGDYPYAAELKNCGELFTYELAFETNSEKLIGADPPILGTLADLLMNDPKLKIQVTGHTDNVGDSASNQALSERRAKFVARLLTERYAVDANRLSAKGYGADQPLTDNDTEQGRAINRRVELVRQ